MLTRMILSGPAKGNVAGVYLGYYPVAPGVASLTTSTKQFLLFSFLSTSGKSFAFNVPKLWNDLPKNATYIASFGKKS